MIRLNRIVVEAHGVRRYKTRRPLEEGAFLMPNSGLGNFSPNCGADIAEARRVLGEKWGVDRPLTAKELSRALGLSLKNGDDHVRNMEQDKTRITGPIKLLMSLYLNGASPPAGIEVFAFAVGEEEAPPAPRAFGQAASVAHVEPVEADRLLTTAELAAHTGLSEAAIGKMRERGDGPEFQRAGRRVLYEGRAVNAWIAERKRQEVAAR